MEMEVEKITDRKEEAKYYSAKRILDTLGGTKNIPKAQAMRGTDENWATKDGIAAGLGIDSKTYDRIALEERGLDYFKDIVAPFDSWPEAKVAINMEMVKTALGLTEPDLKEVFKKDLAQQQKNQKSLEDKRYDKQGMYRTRQDIDLKDISDVKISFLNFVRDKKVSEATELVVDYIKTKLKIYTTKDDNKSEIWIYKAGVYVPQGRSEIRILMRGLLDDFFNMFYFHQVIAKIEADTFIDVDDFFKINYITEIPVKNGILNVLTKETSEFKEEKIFFSKLPVTFDPKAECPKIEKFLSDVLANEEDTAVFYELGGFCLLKDYSFEKAFMFVGDGRNGKGKTMELLKRIVGVKNCSSLPLSALQPNDFSVSGLFGKLVNLAGDISNKDLQHTGMFKQLTGRDLVSAKRKFMVDIEFQNHAKMIFACNDLPMVYDTSKGFWERWVLLEFPYFFADKHQFDATPEKDRKNWKVRDEAIISKITSDEELSGLLNKFLEGLARLLERRTFSSTRGSDEIKSLWIRKANSFMAFCMDHIEEDYNGKISKKDIRKAYSKYCKKHKTGLKTDHVIKNTLIEMYGSNDERHQILGQVEWYWEGIKWKEDKRQGL